MKITDPAQIANLKQEYQEKYQEFNAPKYNSKLSESSRILKIIRVKKFKTPLPETFEALLTMLSRDMHANLKYQDLADDTFYRAGGKDQKRIMHLGHFRENEEVMLEWFTPEAWITKTFKFQAKNKGQKTKLVYFVIIKSRKAKAGYLEQIMRNNYIKAENIRFDIQMWELMRKLGLLKHLSEEKYHYQLSKMQLRLSKVRTFSK
ncbi:hypothetical protein SSYRP_v1c00940 [Spiroplasma syrphidicola EA-1]|uniref:Uncharacterized protein n=1 Tax=Spiroplasma syrphidicola EA-1 TaxID=1276229 RepID=R4UHT8_9MOLU|nr:hypothetical protein [Spiroplasma syrphidicola]AGM25690.1 hypothetical protein SSYRP_v1c00940 [Spiroplasma syrphidicola EA-1]